MDTPVWALKLPDEITDALLDFLPSFHEAPCWPSSSALPTPAARAIIQLRKNMQMTLEEIQKYYSPCEDGGETFRFAWAEYKRDLICMDPEFTFGRFRVPTATDRKRGEILTQFAISNFLL